MKTNQENDLSDRIKRFVLQNVRAVTALPKTVEAQVLGQEVLRSLEQGSNIAGYVSNNNNIPFCFLPKSSPVKNGRRLGK